MGCKWTKKILDRRLTRLRIRLCFQSASIRGRSRFSSAPSWFSILAILRSVSSLLISGKPLPFPDPRLSALIRSKVLLLLFRSPDHPITRDHPIFSHLPRPPFLRVSKVLVFNLGNLSSDPR